MSSFRGVKRMRRRLAAMPGTLQQLARDRIEETVREGAARGRELISSGIRRRTGKMLRFYRASVSRGAMVEGKFGYITDRARREVFYARFLHDGTRYLQGFPFHDIVTEELGPRHRRKMQDALRQTIRGRP